MKQRDRCLPTPQVFFGVSSCKETSKKKCQDPAGLATQSFLAMHEIMTKHGKRPATVAPRDVWSTAPQLLRQLVIRDSISVFFILLIVPSTVHEAAVGSFFRTLCVVRVLSERV